MNILLTREFDNGKDTIGKLYFKTDKLYFVHVLEDTYNEKKIPGSTRIPEGQYEIKLRKEGKFFDKYCQHNVEEIAKLTKQYGVMHLQNVPNFEYILIHTGNTNADTEGCLIVANATENNSIAQGVVSKSTDAYLFLIQSLFPVFDREQLFISIIDYDRNIKKQFGI